VLELLGVGLHVTLEKTVDAREDHLLGVVRVRQRPMFGLAHGACLHAREAVCDHPGIGLLIEREEEFLDLACTFGRDRACGV